MSNPATTVFDMCKIRQQTLFYTRHCTTVTMPFQMKQTVDKKRQALMGRRECLIKQNFAPHGAEGEAQHIGRFVFTAVGTIELARALARDNGH